jgi:integrase
MDVKKNKANMFVYVGKDHTNNNKPFVSISTPDYIPYSLWVSNYLTIHLSGKAFDTSLKYARQLQGVLEYFKSKTIDIEDRVHTGTFFKIAELRAFFNSCKYKSGSEFSNAVRIDVKSDQAIENAIHSGRVAKKLSSADTAKGKIKRFKDFLYFMYTHVHADNLVSEEVKYRYDLAIEYLTECLKKLKDFNTECGGEAESPLPTDAFLELMDIIQVDSPKNPFKRSKFRNYLMVNLYIETGNRRGDHAGLKIQDMKLEGSFDEISIVRRPNDRDDTRKFIPATKTKPHQSHAPKTLMIQVQDYINDVRTQYPKSNNHEFVFVSENNSRGTAGEALSLSSIDKIFEKLTKLIGFKIHCHLLRHKFNEILTELAEEQGLSHDEVEKMRKYMMGWTRDSAMAERYNRFKIYKSSQALNKARQDKMTAAADEGDTV